MCKWRRKFGIFSRDWDCQELCRPIRRIGRDFGRTLQKSRVPHPPFSRGHRPVPTKGQGWARFGQFSLSPGVCVNGARNAVSLAAIRVVEESPLASRRIGRNFGRVLQKSWGAVRHYLGAATQTVIPAKGGPNLANFCPSPGVCKWRQKYGILTRDYGWGSEPHGESMGRPQFR